jgi:hypothetical protein
MIDTGKLEAKDFLEKFTLHRALRIASIPSVLSCAESAKEDRWRSRK